MHERDALLKVHQDAWLKVKRALPKRDALLKVKRALTKPKLFGAMEPLAPRRGRLRRRHREGQERRGPHGASCPTLRRQKAASAPMRGGWETKVKIAQDE